MSATRSRLPALLLFTLLLAACSQPPATPAPSPTSTVNATPVSDGSAAPAVSEGVAAGATENSLMNEPQSGVIVDGSAPSPTLDEEILYKLYLPPGYEASQARYPVLYLLHGRGDDMQAWTLVKPLLDRMIADGDIPPLIAVMPDAPYSERGSYYVDSQYSVGFPLGRPVETAFLQDLLPHVDESYRTIAHRNARAVGGYSMGGYGALRYALAHPDIFMGALVLSPAVYTPLPPSDSSVREFGAFGLENELFVDEIYRQKNYPALLEALPQSEERLTLFIAVGDDEWKHPRAEDQQHDLDLEAHLLFNHAVRVPQITAELRVLNGGHDWDVWRPAFAEGLPTLMRRMDLEPPAGASSSDPSEPVSETDVTPDATATPPAPDVGGTTTLIGTPAEDLAGGVAAADDGGLFLALAAGGPIDEQEHAGGKDAVLKKYDAEGANLWTAQLGSSATERPYGVAPDGEGGAYMAGYTGGDLDGQHPGNAEDDAFLARFDAQGQLMWAVQFGQEDAADRAYALTTDASGDAYLAGYTRGSLTADSAGDKDVILAKFAADGTQLWLRQFGTWGEDKGLGLAVDAQGNVYVCGVVRGALAEPAGDFDAFLAAFNGDGESRWARQFGSSGWDQAEAVVASPSGELYLTGMVAGDFAGPLAGDKDIFVARYSVAGERLGAVQFGSEMNDKGADLALAQDGALYLAAFSNGDIAGQQGKFDVILSRYRPDLQREWLLQLGGAADDGADAYAERNLFLALAGENLAVSGLTLGGFTGQTPLGAGDVFLMFTAY